MKFKTVLWWEFLTLYFLFGLYVIFAPAAQAEEVNRVDACMIIGLDVSGSMNPEELQLQYEGTAKALQENAMISAITSGRFSRIALAIFIWSDSYSSTRIIVPWMIISSREEASIAGNMLIQDAPVSQPGRSTSIASAIQRGIEIMSDCPWFGDKQLLNISGDGTNNIGPAPKAFRSLALNLGIIINGIVIGGDPAILRYYEDYVVGPRNMGFVKSSPTINEFADAMLSKFLLEIAMKRF